MTYLCQCCGRRFAEPKDYIYHGEAWGLPFEDVESGCPYCGGAYEVLDDAAD